MKENLYEIFCFYPTFVIFVTHVVVQHHRTHVDFPQVNLGKGGQIRGAQTAGQVGRRFTRHRRGVNSPFGEGTVEIQGESVQTEWDLGVDVRIGSEDLECAVTHVHREVEEPRVHIGSRCSLDTQTSVCVGHHAVLGSL